MRIANHRLADVSFAPAHVRGPAMTPEILVIHYTATLAGAGVVRDWQASTAKASAHLVIEVDGSVTQMVDFNLQAAHAGPSSWRGRAGCNRFSIGIELVNPGPLYKTDTGYVETIRNRAFTGSVIHARHRNGGVFEHWAAYPAEQLDVLKEVSRLLVAEYSLSDVVGHDDIAPYRKIDPGPAFPLRELRSLLPERQGDGADLYRTTTKLNVRAGPGTHFALALGSPLEPNAQLELLEAEGAWRLVRTPDAQVEGWCFGRYLAPV